MENCEAMTSSTHSFAYSYRLVKKCFLKICETSKCHNFFIFQPIFIRFSLLCSKFFTLSSEIKLNLFWISSLRKNPGNKRQSCQLRARRGLSQLNNVLLRARKVLLLYKVYGDSALLVLNETSLNSFNALLVVNGTSLNSFNALLVLNGTLNSFNALLVLNGTSLNSFNALLVLKQRYT